MLDAANAERLLLNINALNAALRALTDSGDNMGTAIVTLRIMPETPDIDLKKIEEEALKLISEFSDERQKKVSVEPIAFGLKSVNITFLMDEAKGDTEPLEKQLTEIEGVNSVECIDVRRIIG